jgi:hypothetical protein
LGEGQSLNIGTQLPTAEKVALKEFLKKHEVVFAWSVADMPRLSRQVMKHRLLVNLEMKPVQQRKRHLGLERQATMKEEDEKLLKAGFIREIKCPKWITNTILVKKSNDSWCMCVDYTNVQYTRYRVSMRPMTEILKSI